MIQPNGVVLMSDKQTITVYNVWKKEEVAFTANCNGKNYRQPFCHGIDEGIAHKQIREDITKDYPTAEIVWV